ncbi:Gfo/Idh/MocA family oxidoreductase [Microbacterium esteraromaticum]|uniref:Gfo/Idh/MocA family oxidoreductase n=1 Tax=Microbacterium esteraromaticum TaxID=57043 RepID=A0A7D7W965_9MICO|nr:Gfo/Idh/MocA family oxidoreductase [Microbacterium esteraromaticum]QMU96878.1 Gfo/Idh/MocA family oxidoreductase [Microbacterium esteraromaticum]
MKVVLIGAGAYARAHANAIRGIAELELVAVVDRDAQRAGQLAAEFESTAFTGVEQACVAVQPDIATVIVPTAAHVDVALQALRGGAHVLLEKPLARSVAECATLAEEADRRGLLVDVVSQRRFQEGGAAVKEALRQGMLGRVGTAHLDTSVWRDDAYFTDAGWRGRSAEGGGNLLNHGWHALDLLIWFLGVPDEAHGFRVTSRVPGVDVEESLAAALRFSGGSLGVLEASLVARGGPRMRLTLTGDRGTAWVEDTQAGLVHIDDRGGTREFRWDSVDADAALRTQYLGLMRAIRGGEQLRVGLDGALQTLQAAELVLAAVADG